MTARSAVAFEAWQLGRNLVAGTRLALFLPVSAHAFRASPAQYAILVAFNMLAWIFAAAANSGFEGSVEPSAFPVYLSTVVLVLVTALLVSAAYGQRDRLVLF